MKTCILEYIWLDSKNDFRSKTKVMDLNLLNCDENITSSIIEQLPVWNYDGSSTGQAISGDSEVFLIPVVCFKDPFRRNTTSYLIWCETVNKNMTPLNNSHRSKALKTFLKYESMEPWFGLEQEYFIINPETNKPLGFDNNINPEPQGKYYCSVGTDKALCRIIPEEHLEHCLYAGIKICGLNAEVAPAQWEYQIGPSVGINAGDHLWVSRYILNRLAENHGYNISYHPKPLGNTDWNGSGCHTNFSTNAMREKDGIEYIYTAIKRLANNHYVHMQHYGEHNKLRLSGKHETSSFDKFTFGVGNRNASIRIPNSTLNDSCGYFEDRRPAANCDPYLVTSLVMETSMNYQFDSVETEFDDTLNVVKMGYII